MFSKDLIKVSVRHPDEAPLPDPGQWLGWIFRIDLACQPVCIEDGVSNLRAWRHAVAHSEQSFDAGFREALGILLEFAVET